MTEYEIMDVIGVNTGNLMTGSGIYFTALTAYLVVAYAVGRDLTRFQVGFINVVFILMNLMSALNFTTLIIRNLEMAGKITALTGSGRIMDEGESFVIVSLFVLMRLLMVIGAIVFMWQVRHPKTNAKV